MSDQLEYSTERTGNDLIIHLKPGKPSTEIKVTISTGAKKRRARRKVKRTRRARKQQTTA